MKLFTNLSRWEKHAGDIEAEETHWSYRLIHQFPSFQIKNQNHRKKSLP